MFVIFDACKNNQKVIYLVKIIIYVLNGLSAMTKLEVKLLSAL